MKLTIEHNKIMESIQKYTIDTKLLDSNSLSNTLMSYGNTSVIYIALIEICNDKYIFKFNQTNCIYKAIIKGDIREYDIFYLFYIIKCNNSFTFSELVDWLIHKNIYNFAKSNYDHTFTIDIDNEIFFKNIIKYINSSIDNDFMHINQQNSQMIDNNVDIKFENMPIDINSIENKHKLNKETANCIFNTINNMIVYDNQNIFCFKSNNEIWFKGNDIALILGYKSPRSAIRDLVDNSNKSNIENFIKNGKEIVPFPKDEPIKTIFINEAGLYSLIAKSKLDSAKKFQNWIYDEVLPSIRSSGEYTLNNKIEKFESPYHSAYLRKLDKKNVLYIGYIGIYNNEPIFKFGETTDIFERIITHQKNYGLFELAYIGICNDKTIIETKFKKSLKFDKTIRSILIKNNHKDKELFTITDKLNLDYYVKLMSDLINDHNSNLQNNDKIPLNDSSYDFMNVSTDIIENLDKNTVIENDDNKIIPHNTKVKLSNKASKNNMKTSNISDFVIIKSTRKNKKIDLRHLNFDK